MAQWTGQFCGLTHESKVQDVEHSLRQAIATYKTLPETEREEKLKAIRPLAERLRAARLKGWRARISALTESGSRKSLGDAKAAHLRKREQELATQSVDNILRESEL